MTVQDLVDRSEKGELWASEHVLYCQWTVAVAMGAVEGVELGN